MPDDNNKYVYKYPIDELDRLLDQIHKGIQPLVSDDMMLELQLRERQVAEKIFGEDEGVDVDDPEILHKHRDEIQKALENERRKASTTDVMLMTITPDQKAKIREQMSVSIVRPNPNDPYNTTDEDLYRNKETKEIMDKLKSLKHCYYNQTDFVNAIKIIGQAIEFSLGKTGFSDYPWMSYQEAMKEFNSGKIVFGWCDIPKLIINRITPVTDPEILKGVVDGDVMILNRTDDEDEIRKFNRKRNAQYKPINVDYEITGNDQYQQMVAAHKAGYDTPWSTAIKYKSTSYDPSAMPYASIFGRTLNSNTEKNRPLLFDWSKEGAGEEYFNLLHGKKTNSNDITAILNDANGGIVNTVITSNMNNFLKSMSTTYGDNSGGYNYNLPNFMQKPENPIKFNEDAAAVERSLLASITMNNPIQR